MMQGNNNSISCCCMFTCIEQHPHKETMMDVQP